jgi:hypothetical protein
MFTRAMVVQRSFLVLFGMMTIGCSEQSSPSPFEIQEALMNVTSDAQNNFVEYEASCVKRQGYDTPMKVPKLEQILGQPGVPPAEELLAMDDASLAKLQARPDPEVEPEELTKIRYGRVTIDDATVDGGCSAWAQQQVRTTVAHYDLAVAVQKDIGKAAKRETPLMEPKFREWMACLQPETRRFVQTDGLTSPSSASMTLPYDAYATLRKAGTVAEAREQLGDIAAVQRSRFVDIQTCQEDVEYFTTFDQVRSATIQSVLSTHDTQAFIESMKSDAKQ